MTGALSVRIIAAEGTISPVLLSVGNDAGHVVVELDGAHAVERAVAFLNEHRVDAAASWMEFGRFTSCPVTLFVDGSGFAFIVDSDLEVNAFQQSAGIHFPKRLVDEFIQTLADEHKRFLRHATA